MVEYEAWRRAVQGVEEPVYYLGEQAYRPEKFAEHHRHEHSIDDPVSQALRPSA